MVECDICQEPVEASPALFRLTLADLEGVVIDRRNLCQTCWESAKVRDCSRLGHAMLDDYRRAAGIDR